MDLKTLTKNLNDLVMLANNRNAVVSVEINGKEYSIGSINLYFGKKRPNEVPDPHKVIIRCK